MGVESATYVGDLVPTNPPSSDLVAQGATHINLIKSVLQNSFPSLERAILFKKFATKTANYSILSGDDETIFLVDTTSGNLTFTLPAVPAGPWKVTILKTSNDANTISIVGTVQGGTLANLVTQNDTYTIGGNGSSFVLLDFHLSSLITYAGIQQVGASKLLGNPTGAGASISEITLAAGLAFSGTTLALQAFGSGAIGGVPASGGGTANFLRADGAFAAPPVQSGNWVLLNTLTASNSASLQDTTNITSTYDDYEFVFEDLLAQTSGVGLSLLVHSGGSYQSSSYLASDGAVAGSGFAGETVTGFIPLSRQASVGNTAPDAVTGWVKGYGLANASKVHKWVGQSHYTLSSSNQTCFFGGYWNSAATIDGVQFKFTSGNIVSGTVKIYGRVK